MVQSSGRLGPRFAHFTAGLLALCAATSALSQTHPAVPVLQSRPNSQYTLYLDFGGFSFNGLWGGVASQVPGVTAAYDVDGNAAAFNTTELANIQNIWSRVAEKYSVFGINVSTLDPAIAANQAANDAARQAYYDATPRLMHTVIGGNGSWSGGGGVSYVGVTPFAQATNGYHTNWVFSALAPSNLQFVGEATAHEDGHGLGLYHQSDYNGNTLVNEYSSGTGTGVGSVAPIMGNSYSAQRGLWKSGTAHVNNSGPTQQNDPFVIANDNLMGGFINDGVGHALNQATALPLTNATVINTSLAKGVIVPKSSANPNSTGVANYTSDFWSFATGAGQVTISLVSGRSTITAGLADPGAMLDGTLKILDQAGNTVGTSSSGVLSESLTLTLAGGTYFVEIDSAGSLSPSNLGFFDMGSYFLTGSVVAVPEASTWAMLALGLVGISIARRRRAEAGQP